MGKITDALKKAEQERRKKYSSRQSVDPSSQEPPSQWWKFWQKKELRPRSLSERQLLKKGLSQQRYVAKMIDESGIDPRVVPYYDTDSYLSEQYRSLRTNLLSLQEESGLRTCILTSALHGEGKSITALNMAVVFSELSEKRVLLLDADLHKPSLHYYLNMSAGEGLADLLQKDIPIDTVLQETSIQNLTFLSSGNLPDSPSDLLASKRMGSVLEKLKTQFEFIFIDTPPIVILTDAGILGAVSDATFLVAKVGKTNRESVDRAIKLLQTAGVKIAGTILTNIEYYIPTYIYRYL